MNLLLPDLDIVPADADAPMLAAEPLAPTDVPDWLLADQAPMTVLDAVMRHPAEEINAALAALSLDDLDLQAVLEHLARPATPTTTGAH